jgi:hypothetical protein
MLMYDMLNSLKSSKLSIYRILKLRDYLSITYDIYILYIDLNIVNINILLIIT